MSNQLMNFDYRQQPVRMITMGGEPWFVAKDVCAILEHSNSSQALRQHVDDEDKRRLRRSEGITSGDPLFSDPRVGEFAIVNESGMYALVFGSTLPEAKAFKRWVTHDVLPSIRKTGRYEDGTTAAYNQGHVEAARAWFHSGGNARKYKHSGGYTYAVMTATRGTFKIGQTGGQGMPDSILARLRNPNLGGPLLRVISGGYTREQELFCKLEQFRTNDGVDYFAATPESLAVVYSYRWCKGGRAIEDAYNAMLLGGSAEPVLSIVS